MTITTSRSTLVRTGLGVSMLAALTISACGSDEAEAEFEDAEQAGAEEDQDNGESEDEGSEADPELPQTEPGFIYEELSQEVSVTDTQRPDNGEVITPTGTLSIDEIQTIETVPAETVNLDSVYDDSEAGGNPLDYAAAEGEVFQVVNFTFTPHQDRSHDTSTDLSLHDGASQTHLHELDVDQSHRILISVPEQDSSQLVVSSDGHDQFVDLLTGERNDDDEIAAGYYREVTQQDLNHTFQIDTDPVEVVDTDGRRDPDNIPLNYHVHASSIQLTAWTEEDGWASAGEAWLVADWDFGVERGGDTSSARVEEVNLTFAVDAGGEVAEEEYYEDSTMSSHDEVTLYAAVPIDTTSVELSASGSGAIDLGSFLPRSYSIAGSNVRKFATEPLEVSFPDERYGSDADEVDKAQEDSDEDTDDPDDTDEDQD